jgi:hypothetical protein
MTDNHAAASTPEVWIGAVENQYQRLLSMEKSPKLFGKNRQRPGNGASVAKSRAPDRGRGGSAFRQQSKRDFS